MPVCRITSEYFLTLNYLGNLVKPHVLRGFSHLFNFHNTGNPIDISGAVFLRCGLLLCGVYLWQLWEMIILIKQTISIL